MISEMWFLFLLSISGILANDILPITKTTQPDKDVNAPIIPPQVLEDAYKKAEADAKSRIELEDKLPPSGLIQATTKDVAARHQRFLAYTNTTADLDNTAELYDSGSRYVKYALGLTNDQATFGLKKVKFPSNSKWNAVTAECRALFETSKCDENYKYRNIDASCNNLEHPTWGKTLTCFGRILPPVYSDGISAPRLSEANTELPKVRNISLLIHEALVTPNASYTHMMMAFGQFVNHDVTMGIMTRTVGNHTMISCCPLGENPHPECSLGIEVPPNDKDFYSQNGQTCINFVRSATCSPGCTLGPREHSNQITTYVDGSNIYGSSDKNTKDLRLYQDGLLQSQNSSGEEFLPGNGYPDTDQCTIKEKDLFCFKAGDKRVNEQPGLTSVHNLWMRQHNRLARLYKERYPDLNDEDLYQLTRRVVGAIYQNVVFKEFLPVVLGTKYMNYFNLDVGTDTTYMSNTEATLFNEFMTAANRFGHTIIQNTFERGPDNPTSMNLDEVYFSPFILMEGEYDPILKGLSSQPGKLFDTHLVTAVTHTMYRQKEVAVGMDLASLNIQRGRDQGTAGYTKYIKHCFKKTITSFEDLDQFMSSANRKNLQNVYAHVDDIDLFTGGVSEDRLTGAVVGPTFGCLIGIQFYRLKFGDRFYFEHKEQTASFTSEQLVEIRNTSLAQILCENTKTIKTIVPKAFLIKSDKNEMTSCDNIPKFNYALF